MFHQYCLIWHLHWLTTCQLALLAEQVYVWRCGTHVAQTSKTSGYLLGVRIAQVQKITGENEDYLQINMRVHHLPNSSYK